MNYAKYSIEQELHMTYHPILGTSYHLVDVVLEIEHSYINPTMEYNSAMRHILSTTNPIHEAKDCNHSIKNILRVGYRTYCDICGGYVNKSID